MANIKFTEEGNGYAEFSYGSVYGLVYFDGEKVSVESPADPFFEVHTKAMSLDELKEDGPAYRKVIACIEKYIEMAMA